MYKCNCVPGGDKRFCPIHSPTSPSASATDHDGDCRCQFCGCYFSNDAMAQLDRIAGALGAQDTSDDMATMIIERAKLAAQVQASNVALIAQLARAEAEKAELLCDLREVNANNAAQFERAEEAEERVKLLAAAMQIHGVPLP